MAPRFRPYRLLLIALLALAALIGLLFTQSNASVALAGEILQIDQSPTPLATAVDVQTFVQLAEVGQEANSFSDTRVVMDIASNGFPVIVYGRDSQSFIRCLDATCSTRNVGTLLNAGRLGSMALDSQDRIVFSYQTSMYGGLWIARCLDLECTSRTSTELVPVDRSSSPGILVLQAGDIPVILYAYRLRVEIDGNLAYPISGLFLSRCTIPDCSSVTTHQISEDTRDSTKTSPQQLLLDTNGVPVIAYRSYIDRQFSLTIASCESSTSCAAPTLWTFDTFSAEFLDMTLDAQNNPRILYVIRNHPVNYQIILVSCTDPACQNQALSMVIDSVTFSDVAYRADTRHAGIVNSDNGEFFIGYDQYLMPGGHFYHYLKVQRCTNLQCTPRTLTVISSEFRRFGAFGTLALGQNRLFLVFFQDILYQGPLGPMMLYSEDLTVLNPTLTPTITPSPTITMSPSLTLTPSRTASITPSSLANAPAQRNRFDVPEVSLFWSPVGSASEYELQIASDSAFSQIVYQESGIIAPQVSLLLNDGRYYWRVRAQLSGARLTNWSAVDSFVVLAETDTPTPTLTLTPSVTLTLTTTRTPSATPTMTPTYTSVSP
jgi:hypothetical protein